MIAKTLNHYEIGEQLGAGGMGAVYRAKDRKLGRDVAVKVLPDEFARDADRVARFQREAKVLASLNHPNIAAIHGLEESAGTNFLVLELVEGETLADRIKQGPIPVEESLKLALQIAEALEAAHEKGVIHRDLKPANIKATPEGKVKVLDFGLAKAYAGDQEASLSNSPTLSNLATQQGIILGTAAYMAPEQARGKNVDKRADNWAFGCLLYEMLTGEAAFQGEDVTEILAAVVKGGANLDLLPANLHPRVREVITRCLQRDLRRRYSSITEARYEIEQALADPTGLFLQPVTAVKQPRRRLRLGLPWVAAVFVLGLILAGVAVWNLKPSEPRQVTRLDHVLAEDQQFGNPTERVIAVAPDGRKLVYATSAGLYLRAMDDLEARIIPGSTENAQKPFFSPDGQWVGYGSGAGGHLKKIPISGGAPIPLTANTSQGYISWGSDNSILYADASGIMQMSPNGGSARAIVEKGGTYYAPQLLPDGKSVLFTISLGEGFKIAVQSLNSKERKILFSGDTAQYLPTGHIVYAVGNSLFAVAFDPDKLEPKGSAVSVVEGVMRMGGAPQYAVSDSGTLVYVPGSEGSIGRTLVWVDRSGAETPINVPPRTYAYAMLSPDGARVALDIRDQDNDIWIWELDRQTLARLTFNPGMNRGPVWTPDGRRIAFSIGRGNEEGIYWQSADGSGAPELVYGDKGATVMPNAFSPDGKQLLFSGTGSPYDVSLIKLEHGAKPVQLLASTFDELNPRISPDGRWLAYESNESGRSEIYVRPFPNVNAGRWQISTDGGTRPLWNRHGRELFYYLPPGTMMAVPVELGSTFKAGNPRLLFKGDYLSPQTGIQYSATPDGKRFLMIKGAQSAGNKASSAARPPKINIVLNWTEELKQRVPVK